jgi:hypothetical protein
MTSPKNAITDEMRQEVIVDILNHVTEVLWHFFSENETGLDNEEAISEFVNHLWNIAVACMASVGMEVLEKNGEDEYVIGFTPVKNVKEFLNNNS